MYYLNYKIEGERPNKTLLLSAAIPRVGEWVTINGMHFTVLKVAYAYGKVLPYDVYVPAGIEHDEVFTAEHSPTLTLERTKFGG